MSGRMHSFTRREFSLCAGGLTVLLAAAGVDAILNRGLNDPVALAGAIKRLNRVPQTIGSWSSTAGEIDERERRLAEIAGSVRREYRNSETGHAVTLTILCGAAGPMSVHPPTACFEGVGYELVSGPSNVKLTPGPDFEVSLNKAAFRLHDAPVSSEMVRVFWGWSDDGIWEAPANPRMTFRGRPVLFKLYLVDRSLEEANAPEQSESFLAEALPVIRKALQP
jgi:hypothetical protein